MALSDITIMQAKIDAVRQQSAEIAQEWRSELASIKELLRGLITQKNPSADQSVNLDPSGSYCGTLNRIPHDPKPPDLTDAASIQPQPVQPRPQQMIAQMKSQSIADTTRLDELKSNPTSLPSSDMYVSELKKSEELYEEQLDYNLSEMVQSTSSDDLEAVDNVQTMPTDIMDAIDPVEDPDNTQVRS